MFNGITYEDIEKLFFMNYSEETEAAYMKEMSLTNACSSLKYAMQALKPYQSDYEDIMTLINAALVALEVMKDG